MLHSIELLCAIGPESTLNLDAPRAAECSACKAIAAVGLSHKCAGKRCYWDMGIEGTCIELEALLATASLDRAVSSPASLEIGEGPEVGDRAAELEVLP